LKNFNPEYGNAVEGAIDVLRKLTASVTQVNLPGKYQAATRALMIRSDDVKPEAYAEARRQVEFGW
jgi:hypothetical protein